MNEPGEKPIEFRTSKSHWKMYPRAGTIIIYNLRADASGERLVPGVKRIELTRKFFKDRPDLLEALITVLLTWRKQ